MPVQGLEAIGVPYAEVVNAGVGIVLSGGAGTAANVAKNTGRWASRLPDHPAGFDNPRFGEEIAQWGTKQGGISGRLQRPVSASDIQRAREAGYTKEHFIGWRNRYLETATKTANPAVPEQRAELMQKFIDAWD